MAFLVLYLLKYLLWPIVIYLGDNLLCNFKFKIILIWLGIDPIHLWRSIILCWSKIKISCIFIRLLFFYWYFFMMFRSSCSIFFITWSLFCSFWPISFLKLKIWVQICMPELNFSLNLVSIVTIILNLCVSVDGEIVSVFEVYNTFFL